MAFETFEITHGIEDSKPILPPLHTLNLPFISSRPSNDNLRYDQRNSRRNNTYVQCRRMSTSSSCTSPSESGPFSRTTSPSLSDSPSSVPSPFSSLPTKFRLEPCTLDKADAVILIPPQSTTNGRGASESANLGELTITTTSKTKTSSTSKPLFLVGPALHHFRLRPPSSRPLAKGARVHPYRIVRNYSKDQSQHSINDNTGLRRRSSTVSFTGLTHVRLPLQELELY